MARDIFCIPITIVASESAFSVGGRILDDYRSSLSKDMVEILVCGSDWIKALTNTTILTLEVCLYSYIFVHYHFNNLCSNICFLFMLSNLQKRRKIWKLRSH
ncbi:putative HAT dimerization domain, ribonuclease H-like superfamily [Helianthus anomalus]